MEVIFNSYHNAHYDEYLLTNTPIFQQEGFRACLLGFLPGQVLPRHLHEHEHEVFDVLEGKGTIWLGDEPVQTEPGTSVFVPANTLHGFENDSDGRWLVRATIYERTYLRKAFWRAILKRLSWIKW